MNGLMEDSSEQVGRNGSVAARRGWALPILAARIWREISVLDPAYFALVMATGIVSNTLFLEGEHALSDLLLAVNFSPIRCCGCSRGCAPLAFRAR